MENILRSLTEANICIQRINFPSDEYIITKIHNKPNSKKHNNNNNDEVYSNDFNYTGFLHRQIVRVLFGRLHSSSRHAVLAKTSTSVARNWDK